MLGRTRRIHFVGIGGIGMSGIAELLANLGFAVTGSDEKTTEITDRLAAECGVSIQTGHAAEHVGDADVVVVTSAVRPSNAEVVEARRRGIPVIQRAEMLAELMRLRFSIGVAGAHGKTTTTSMIALVLERAGLDPTAVIGGRLSAFGSNARLGRSDYMVAEADESDRSFLLLSPAMAVITNIDHEHMESYGSFDNLQQAFVDFANKVPFYGAVIACADDAEVSKVLPRMTKRVVTYGIDTPDAGIRATRVEVGAFGSRCVVSRGGDVLGPLTVQVPGRHNLLNALAAVAVADKLRVPFEVIASTLAAFEGAERRFQRYGEAAGVLVIDDYGHHPREIAAVVEAARATLGRRLVVAFQPHRFTRTQQLLADFGPALRDADEVVLTDIYAAGEDPIPGITLESLAEAMRPSVRSMHIARALKDIVPTLLRVVRPGDAVITLGAGSIGTVAKTLMGELQRKGAAG